MGGSSFERVYNSKNINLEEGFFTPSFLFFLIIPNTLF